MADSSYKTLSDALAYVLHSLGASLLDDPKRLMAALSDVADQQSKEMRVLRHHGNERLLGFYKAASTGDVEALRGAAGRAERYLIDECVVDASTAHEVAWQLAQGVAGWRGMSLPVEREQKKAEAKEAEARKRPMETKAPKADATRQGGAGSGHGGSGKASAAAAAAAAAATRQSQQPTQPPVSTPANQTGPSAGPSAPPKDKGLSRGGVVALVVVGLLAFIAWRMFGWRIGLDTEAYVTSHVQTTLSNGYVSSQTDYLHDLYGNPTSSEGSFETEDGDTFETHESYGGYDDYGYAATYDHSYTVTEAGGKFSSRSETREESEYRYDPSGRLHSKVVTTTEKYQHENGEWNEPEVTKELVVYHYENDLPFGLANLWTTKNDGSFDAVVVMEYDKDLHIVSYTNDSTLADGSTSHYESVTSYSYAGGKPTSSRNTSTYTSGSYSSTMVTDTTYDSEGNVTRETVKDDGQIAADYVFEHDANGNLTKRTNKTDGSVTTWTHRWVSHASIPLRTGIS